MLMLCVPFSLVVASLPVLGCPLLTILLRKEEGRFAHLLLLQWFLQQLPALDLLHFAITCTTCREAVDICLRKTIGGLPFQAETAFSDIEYCTLPPASDAAVILA